MFDFYLGLPNMDVQVQLVSLCCFSVVSLVWLARMRERDASTSSTSWSQEQTQKWEVIAYYWHSDDEGGIAAVQRVKHYSSLALFSGLHWIGSGEEQLGKAWPHYLINDVAR